MSTVTNPTRTTTVPPPRRLPIGQLGEATELSLRYRTLIRQLVERADADVVLTLWTPDDATWMTEGLEGTP